MAALKVGMRVRVVGADLGSWQYLSGREGVIEAEATHFDWWVRINAPHVFHNPDKPGCFALDSSELAPLTDPSADAFLARLKKLGSEPVNAVEKVTVREGK